MADILMERRVPVVSMHDAVRFARWVIERDGPDSLPDFQEPSFGCACPGPSHGYSSCACKLNGALKHNMVHILQEIDPELALKVMRIKIIKALR